MGPLDDIPVPDDQPCIEAQPCSIVYSQEFRSELRKIEMDSSRHASTSRGHRTAALVCFQSVLIFLSLKRRNENVPKTPTTSFTVGE
jgi:hypothetical protein